MKCYKLLFSKDGFINNIGNYLLLTIISFNIIASIIFYLKGYNNLKTQIQEVVEQLKDIEKNNNVKDNLLTNKEIKIFYHILFKN